MITIPDDATPADVVGETEILAGQDWLDKANLLEIANLMLNGEFPWHLIDEEEEMAFQVGTNGTVISQGHHRWVAARLAGVEIPAKILIHRDYWPDAVPWAVQWADVKWK